MAKGIDDFKTTKYTKFKSGPKAPSYTPGPKDTANTATLKQMKNLGKVETTTLKTTTPKGKK